METIPFLIEGKGVPKELNRPDIEFLYKEHGERLKPYTDAVRDHFSQMWDILKANTDKLSADEIENYVTHIWEVKGKENIADIGNWFATKNKFLKKRYIESLSEGIKMGFTPKHLDVGTIMKIHTAMAAQVITNNTFVDAVKQLERQGVKMVMPESQAPRSWKTLEHPALSQIKVTGSKKGMPMIDKERLAFHPDLARPLKVVFGKSDYKFEIPTGKEGM